MRTHTHATHAYNTPPPSTRSNGIYLAVGFDKSGGGIPRAVALCYAATDPHDATPDAASQALRAAVAPHVALQLLPDVRPLLPALHGFLVAPAAEASSAGPLRDRDRRTWLVYSIQGQCLALHLEHQPQHFLPAKLVVRYPPPLSAPSVVSFWHLFVFMRRDGAARCTAVHGVIFTLRCRSGMPHARTLPLPLPAFRTQTRPCRTNAGMLVAMYARLGLTVSEPSQMTGGTATPGSA